MQISGPADQIRLVYLHGVQLRRFGVPPTRPRDRESAALALALEGLSETEPIVEIFAAKANLTHAAGKLVALVGAGYQQLLRVPSDRFSIRPEHGMILYLACPELRQDPYGNIFGSPTALGDPAHMARPPESVCSARAPHVSVPFVSAQPNLSRVKAIVSPIFDRKGVRLHTDLPNHNQRITSHPTTPGLLQWTPSGEVIVLQQEGPVIGGYPSLGFLGPSGLNTVAHLHPGQEFELVACSEESLQTLEQHQRTKLNQNLAQIRANRIKFADSISNI